MMKAEVIAPFKGVRDGEVYPRQWQEGDVIEGELAAAAVRGGMAKMLAGAPENKATRAKKKETTGRTGRGQSSSSRRAGRRSGARTSKHAGDAPSSS